MLRLHRPRDSPSQRDTIAPCDPQIALYRDHRDLVLAFLMRRTGNRELAADLMMEVFAAAILHGRRHPPPDEPAAWLVGVARNKLADSYRRGAAETRARERLGTGPVALEDDDLQRIDALTDEHRVLELLDALPAAQRDAVRAHVLADEGYDEIARDLGTSELVVRKRVSRGLARLRTTMDGYR
jgi:RNA polymerase sigma factor (sigma-70 family)